MEDTQKEEYSTRLYSSYFFCFILANISYLCAGLILNFIPIKPELFRYEISLAYNKH